MNYIYIRIWNTLARFDYLYAHHVHKKIFFLSIIVYAIIQRKSCFDFIIYFKYQILILQYISYLYQIK